MSGHRRLDDVGGVRAKHHQLAMSHVDDAHDAKRDRQPDSDQHEHRSQTQAKKQSLNRRNRRFASASIVVTRRRCGMPHLFVRFARNCRREISRSRLASLFRTSWIEAVARASRRRQDAPSDREAVQMPQAPDPSAIAFFTPGIRFHVSVRSRSSATFASSSERNISCTASSRTAASGLDSPKRATVVLRTRRRAIVGSDLCQLIGRN